MKSYKKYLTETLGEDNLLDFDTIADIVASDEELLKMMGEEELDLEDLENNSIAFFNFIIRHLDFLKNKYNFDSNYEFLRKDFGSKYV